MSERVNLNKDKVIALVESEKALKEEVESLRKREKYLEASRDAYRRDVRSLSERNKELSSQVNSVKAKSIYGYQKEAAEYAEKARVEGLRAQSLQAKVGELEREVAQKEYFRSNLISQRSRLIAENERLRNRVAQLKGEVLGLGYGVGGPMNETERDQWRARVQNQSESIATLQAKVERYHRIIDAYRRGRFVRLPYSNTLTLVPPGPLPAVVNAHIDMKDIEARILEEVSKRMPVGLSEIPTVLKEIREVLAEAKKSTKKKPPTEKRIAHLSYHGRGDGTMCGLYLMNGGFKFARRRGECTCPKCIKAWDKYKADKKELTKKKRK